MENSMTAPISHAQFAHAEILPAEIPNVEVLKGAYVCAPDSIGKIRFLEAYRAALEAARGTSCHDELYGHDLMLAILQDTVHHPNPNVVNAAQGAFDELFRHRTPRLARPTSPGWQAPAPSEQAFVDYKAGYQRRLNLVIEKLKWMATPKVGETFKGEGVYLKAMDVPVVTGPVKGKLALRFYAAPKDLEVASTWRAAEQQVSGIRNYHGHHGAERSVSTFDRLCVLLRKQCIENNNYYSSGWMIMPQEIVSGRDASGMKVMEGSMFDHRDTGDLIGTFASDKAFGDNHYWTSTQGPNGTKCFASFDTGRIAHAGKDRAPKKCRPGRVEARLIPA
jgi:hypothetical protein